MPPCYVITSMVSKSLLPNVRVPSSPTSISWAKKCWQHVSETTFSLLIRLYKGHQEQVMSNSTFLRPFGSKRTSSSGRLISFTQISSWSRVASFYCTLIYRFPLNSFLSVLRVAVIKLGDEKNAYPSPFCQGKSRKITLYS